MVQPPAPLNALDAKLMLAMIGHAETIKVDNDKLAELVGEGLTANAVRLRVHKIKTHAKLYLDGTKTDFNGMLSAGANVKASPLAGIKRKATTAGDGSEKDVTPSKNIGGPKGRKTEKTKGSEGVTEAEI